MQGNFSKEILQNSDLFSRLFHDKIILEFIVANEGIIVITTKDYDFFSNVTPQKVDWLWGERYIPMRKTTLLAGDPGSGKSTISLFLASCVSNGIAMPFDTTPPISGNVIYLTAEDSNSDTIRPRLDTFGADCSKIAFLTKPVGENFNILEDAIADLNAKLCVLDPVIGYIGNGDLSRAGDMRPFMTRLGEIAEKHNCALLMVAHLNKNEGSKALYRTLGSVDIVAHARSVLQITCEEDSDIRTITHVKSSLAKKGEPLSFIIGDDSRIEFLENYEDATPTETLIAPTKTRRAMEIMQARLHGRTTVPFSVLRQACIDAGLGERTISEAKKALGIVSFKKGAHWFCSLPEDEDAQ